MSDVNIWALEKDQEIKFLLLSLTQALGVKAFSIDTAQPLDRRAIYLCHPEVSELRAYLYSIGQSHGRYGAHLEYPGEIIANNLMDIYENQTLSSIAQMLAVHFDIADIADPLKN